MEKSVSVSLSQLEGMQYSQLLSLVGISDEQAVDSELEGDSDADDGFPSRAPSSGKRKKTTGEESESTGSSSMEVSSGEQSSASVPSDDEDFDQPTRLPRIPVVPVEEVSSSSSEEDVEETHVPQWKKGQSGSRIEEHFKKCTFKEPFGPKVPIDIENIVNIFFIFFNESLMNLIVDQSNLYGSQNGQNLKLERDELCCFLGILLIMGFHQLPSLCLYWSTNNNFHCDRISKLMSLRRFLTILRYLHLNDNSQMPPRGTENVDKLFKIRPLLDHFSKRFLEVFSPSRFLSIDESMIAFKGRSTLKQYLPLKPIKRGFKVWAVCCSVTGYLLAFDFYAGKNPERTTSLGEQVVLDLSRSFEGLGYCLFFDRFFSSFGLMKTLLSKGLHACATILQTRRYFPSSLLLGDKNLKYGQSDYCSTKDFGLVKWKDRGTKCVCVTSTMDNPAKSKKIARKNKKGEKVEVECPEPIVSYNKYVGGVDLFDKYMAYYPTHWKSRRWWMKAFYYFFDAACVNSYILYKEELKKRAQELQQQQPQPGGSKRAHRSKGLSHLMFRSQLADELIADFSSRKVPIKSVTITKKKTVLKKVVPSPKGHLPVKCKQRRCAFCSTKKDRKRTTIKCDTCDVGLCIQKCFKNFHDQL